MRDERKVREIEFHNEAYEQQERKKIMSLYSITQGIIARYEERLTRDCAGKKILEYGCGEGSFAFLLAEQGGLVTGFDISDFAIQQAKNEAARRKLNIIFLVMDAENLEFDDRSFDLVCGSGILHHLLLDRSLGEIKRVLVKGGRGVFAEPLGHNMFINLFRRLTPSKRTKDEHPLRASDLELMAKMFPNSRFTFYYLTTLIAMAARRMPFQKGLVEFLDRCDQFLFRVFPFLKKYAWQVLIELENTQE
jgi:ubiquinone/menaquinone biosynthesis C-methylase UbiE